MGLKCNARKNENITKASNRTASQPVNLTLNLSIGVFLKANYMNIRASFIHWVSLLAGLLYLVFWVKTPISARESIYADIVLYFIVLWFVLHCVSRKYTATQKRIPLSYYLILCLMVFIFAPLI